jgi:hypothetical protein
MTALHDLTSDGWWTAQVARTPKRYQVWRTSGGQPTAHLGATDDAREACALALSSSPAVVWEGDTRALSIFPMGGMRGELRGLARQLQAVQVLSAAEDGTPLHDLGMSSKSARAAAEEAGVRIERFEKKLVIRKNPPTTGAL